MTGFEELAGVVARLGETLSPDLDATDHGTVTRVEVLLRRADRVVHDIRRELVGEKTSETTKQNARAAVHRAIKAGKLTRELCQECGAEYGEAHHSCYCRDCWLRVEWLCSACHRVRHMLDRRKWLRALSAVDGPSQECFEYETPDAEVAP